MVTSNDVKERLPGLSFRVEMSEISRPGARVGAPRTGKIVLTCTINNEELWNDALEKFDGFKVYDSTTEELISALSDELDTRETAVAKLTQRVEEQEAENTRLRELLAGLGRDLGIE